MLLRQTYKKIGNPRLPYLKTCATYCCGRYRCVIFGLNSRQRCSCCGKTPI